MGVNTKVNLKGHITDIEILNFIKQKFDKNAESFVKKSDYGDIQKYSYIKEIYDDSDKWIINSGFICFEYNGNRRSLSYFYQNTNFHENLDYYSEYGLEDMVKSETTSLSLSYNSDAIEIMKQIVSYYGGWIDENDCDEKPYYYVEKDTDIEQIKPPRYVTMQEVYKKFGEVVIIKN